jgi:hypothetical protein
MAPLLRATVRALGPLEVAALLQQHAEPEGASRRTTVIRPVCPLRDFRQPIYESRDCPDRVSLG